jgi:hypothetical protein
MGANGEETKSRADFIYVGMNLSDVNLSTSDITLLRCMHGAAAVDSLVFQAPKIVLLIVSTLQIALISVSGYRILVTHMSTAG